MLNIGAGCVGRTGGRPDRLLDRRRRPAHRRDADRRRARTVGARSTLAPGRPRSARTPRSHRVRAVFGRVRPGSAGRARRRRGWARPGGAGPGGPPRARRWVGRLRRRRGRPVGCSRSLGRRRPAARRGRRLRDPDRCAGGGAALLAAARGHGRLAAVALAVAARASRAPARASACARAPPRAQPRRLAGLGDRAADRLGADACCSRCTRACSPRSGCARWARRSAATSRRRPCSLLPKMTTVGDGAFLADDTMVASYELGGGWLRIERVADRQARVPRQLRHGRARGAPCPRTGWSPCCRRRRTRRRAGSSWLGIPPVRLRALAATNGDRAARTRRRSAEGRPRRWSSSAAWCR